MQMSRATGAHFAIKSGTMRRIAIQGEGCMGDMIKVPLLVIRETTCHSCRQDASHCEAIQSSNDTVALQAMSLATNI